MEPFFFDTGGIDLFVDPNDRRLLTFWKRFPKNTRHFLSHIVYWEHLRQFSPNRNSLERQHFLHRVDRDGFEFLNFGRDEADIAVDIYVGLKQRFPRTAAGKRRLKEMHCDIMIAAIAVSRDKRVLTADVGDWADIKLVVEAGKIGVLRVHDRKDITA
ncbi:MAG TPA: hypothetical protein VMV69_14240 [Pirellulales bacterium]|nr:hypothetical protein [Pirellulales bacterium]